MSQNQSIAVTSKTPQSRNTRLLGTTWTGNHHHSFQTTRKKRSSKSQIVFFFFFNLQTYSSTVTSHYSSDTIQHTFHPTWVHACHLHPPLHPPTNPPQRQLPMPPHLKENHQRQISQMGKQEMLEYQVVLVHLQDQEVSLLQVGPMRITLQFNRRKHREIGVMRLISRSRKIVESSKRNVRSCYWVRESQESQRS